MSALLATARAMDDQLFRWRVMGACIQHAAGYQAMPDGPGKEYALRVLASPHDVNQMMLCLVASNPQISQSIDVDENGTITANEVPDGDILYVVVEAWPIVADRYATEAG
mgnify:CR=1 FL=1